MSRKATKRSARLRKPIVPTEVSALRLRAEARLGKQPRARGAQAEPGPSQADSQRLLHELQVHQIEMEMQNAELRESRERMENLLEKYIDLYDFAPVGYFSLDDTGRILEANLTGASLLGVERSRLLNQRLPQFVVATSQAAVQAFVKRAFAGAGKVFCEAAVSKPGGATLWVGLHGTTAIAASTSEKWCRVAVADITAAKEAEATRARVATLTAMNRNLAREVVKRQASEASLRTSEQQQRHLLIQARFMQEQLRHLSRKVLHAQEEERLRISRELHDVIAQTLTGINIRLAHLQKEAKHNPKGLTRNIARTQRLVENTVDTVHRFARELRPAMLDDLGLIPALHAHLKEFRVQNHLQVNLSAFPTVEKMTGDQRTVLYRVAQEALANAARHAKASRVEIRFQKRGDILSMTIRDNGQGFQAEHVLQIGARKSQRLGLLGMRERLEMIGGIFMIESAPRKGTTVRVQIPLTAVTRGRASIPPVIEHHMDEPR